jgi:hypothetical protein
MRDRGEPVAPLRKEFSDPHVEAPRPRAVEAVQRDENHMAEIKDALTAFGTVIGPRAGDILPEAG